MLFFPKKSVRVSVRDKKVVIETKSGVNLYKFLISERIIQQTLCNGSGQCGKCKIRFIGANIPKPTYKETLILAKVNIEAGYRLACQHTVKKDIEIDTSEMPASSTFLPIKQDYPKALKDPAQTKIEKPIENITTNNDTQDNTNIENTTEKTEQQPLQQEVVTDNDENALSINEFQPMASKARPHESHEEEGPSDGIFMIQQRGRIRYFCYSAALDNIVSEGTIETDQTIHEAIEKELIPDFIHNVLKIKDIDRALILIEKHDNYQTDNLLDIVEYFKFDEGTLLCEVLMPFKDNYDIIRFFRLLNADRNNKLIFSLDMLDRVHYLTDKLVTDMKYYGLAQANILAVQSKGKNSITDFDENLLPSGLTNKSLPPDGVTVSAVLKLTKLLLKKGIIDQNFTIKPRAQLLKIGLPLDITIRVTGKETSTGFYMFRDRFGELLLTQEDLYALAEMRDYIVTVINYVQQRIGRVNGLIFYTNANHDNIINLLFDLGFIPKDFADKTTYLPGDATIQAIKLFKEKDITSFMARNFNNIASIALVDEDIFKSIGKETGLLD